MKIIERLPAVVRELIAIVGWPATIALVVAFGGRKLRVPKGTGGAAAAMIAEVAGETALERIVARFGGEDIYVPFCRDAARLTRNIEICRAYDAGTGINAMVDTYGLSYRQIETILKTTDVSAAPEESTQGVLELK